MGQEKEIPESLAFQGLRWYTRGISSPLKRGAYKEELQCI